MTRPGHSRILSAATLLLFCYAIPAKCQLRLNADAAEKLLVEAGPLPNFPSWWLERAGTVRIDIFVSEVGSVVTARKISGPATLVPRALEVAKSRRYKPYLLAGRPTPFVTTIEISFDTAESRAEMDDTRKLEEQAAPCEGLMSSDPGKWERDCAYGFSAFDLTGYGMYWMGQYQQVLDRYSKLGSNLQQRDDLGFFAYRNLGHAHLGLGQFNMAREFYRKAERSFPAIYEKLENRAVKRRYQGFLNETFRFHLAAAQKAGDAAEVAEITKKLAQQAY